MKTPEGPDPREGTRRWFPWKWLLALLAVMTPLVLLWAYLFVDEPPFDDSNLEPRQRATRPEGLGWMVFEDDGYGFPWIEPPSQPQLVEDISTKRLDEWLGESEMGWIYLHWGDSIERKVSSLRRKGGEITAAREALKFIRMARAVRLIEFNSWQGTSTSVRMESRGLELLVGLLKSNRALFDAVADMPNDFLAGTVNSEDFAQSARHAYVRIRRFLKKIGTGEQGFVFGDMRRDIPEAWAHRRFYLPHRSLRLAAEALRSDIRNFSLPVSEWDYAEPPESVWTGMGGLFKWLPVRNGIGNGTVRFFLEMFDDSLSEEMDRAFDLRLRCLFIDTWIALELYRNERGHHPAHLDELVPSHLKTVPMDLYDGEPLRYSWQMGIVYSVGEDLEDSGGSRVEGWEAAWSDKNEPTLRLHR